MSETPDLIIPIQLHFDRKELAPSLKAIFPSEEPQPITDVSHKQLAKEAIYAFRHLRKFANNEPDEQESHEDTALVTGSPESASQSSKENGAELMKDWLRANAEAIVGTRRTDETLDELYADRNQLVPANIQRAELIWAEVINRLISDSRCENQNDTFLYALVVQVGDTFVNRAEIIDYIYQLSFYIPEEDDPGGNVRYRLSSVSDILPNCINAALESSDGYAVSGALFIARRFKIPLTFTVLAHCATVIRPNPYLLYYVALSAERELQPSNWELYLEILNRSLEYEDDTSQDQLLLLTALFASNEDEAARSSLVALSLNRVERIGRIYYNTERIPTIETLLAFVYEHGSPAQVESAFRIILVEWYDKAETERDKQLTIEFASSQEPITSDQNQESRLALYAYIYGWLSQHRDDPYADPLRQALDRYAKPFIDQLPFTQLHDYPLLARVRLLTGSYPGATTEDYRQLITPNQTNIRTLNEVNPSILTQFMAEQDGRNQKWQVDIVIYWLTGGTIDLDDPSVIFSYPRDTLDLYTLNDLLAYGPIKGEVYQRFRTDLLKYTQSQLIAATIRMASSNESVNANVAFRLFGVLAFENQTTPTPLLKTLWNYLEEVDWIPPEERYLAIYNIVNRWLGYQPEVKEKPEE